MQLRAMFSMMLLAALAACAGADDVFTDPADPKLPADFAIQGEYVGKTQDGAAVGAQVIALGKVRPANEAPPPRWA